jgi:RNA polymerase sigma-70 factor (ECF subfamily)
VTSDPAIAVPSHPRELRPTGAAVPSSSAIGTEALFRAHASFVVSFVFRLGARGAQVDDLVQDVFLLAHHRGGYRAGAASPTTFLARLALEAMHGMRRRDRRFVLAHSEPIAAAALGSELEAPDSALALQRAARDLQGALDAIEPERRAVFILFELHGESCDAIAAAFDLKVGTVYSRLHAARKEFRTSLARTARAHEPR